MTTETALDLEAIEARISGHRAAANAAWDGKTVCTCTIESGQYWFPCQDHDEETIFDDTAMLIAEVRRLRLALQMALEYWDIDGPPDVREPGSGQEMMAYLDALCGEHEPVARLWPKFRDMMRESVAAPVNNPC